GYTAGTIRDTARGADATRRTAVALREQYRGRDPRRRPGRVDTGTALQHGDGVVRGRGRRVQRPSLAAESFRRQLRDRADPGPLVSRIFLAPVRQQRLYRCDGNAAGAGHRLADHLLGWSDAHTQRMVDHQRSIDDIRDPGVVPGDPVLPD